MKLQRYAAGGVVQLWIVNLAEDLVEVYQRAEARGYREHVAVGRGQSLALPGVAERLIAVDDILG